MMMQQRVTTILLALAAATVVVGCGGHGDRVQSAPDSGHVNLLTRAQGLPEGHPPIDPHPRRWVLPEGHPPVREMLPACPGLGRTLRQGPGAFEDTGPEVPELISI
jgi:hypothetical protein